MSGLTKAQLRDQLAEAVARIEEANVTIREQNVALTKTCRERDQALSGNDPMGIAKAINEHRAYRLQAEERATKAEALRLAAEGKARGLTDRVAGLAHEVEVLELQVDVGALKLDNTNLRHDIADQSQRSEQERQNATIRNLRARVANPDLPLTLDNGQGVTLEHSTYGGRWKVDGYNILVEGGARSIQLTLTKTGGAA